MSAGNVSVSVACWNFGGLMGPLMTLMGLPLIIMVYSESLSLIDLRN